MPDVIHVCGSWWRFHVWTGKRRRCWPAPLRVGGVYAIYQDGRLIYVGSTVNLSARLSNHFSCGWFARHQDVLYTVKVSPMPYGWVEREKQLVKRLRPQDNRQWAKPRSDKGRSRNLLPRQW